MVPLFFFTNIKTMCNLSMERSKYPLNCKIAKLKPLHNKGPKTDPKNYCLVSLLPIFQKLQRKLFIIKPKFPKARIKFYANVNQGFENHFQRTLLV